MPKGLHSLVSRRRLVAVGLAVLFSLLSCGREVTGPGDGIGVQYATGLAFISEFPSPLQGIAQGVGSVVSFDRVRILLRRSNGAVALDTTVAFGANVDSLSLSLRVPLSGSAPPSGELLALTLAYANTAGDTVFRGGPVSVLAKVLAPSEPPPQPVSVPLSYTGVGATATSLVISPDTLRIVAGEPFAFSGAAFDAQGQPIPGTPLVYRSLNPLRAPLTAPGAGSGTIPTAAPRGPAHILAQLPTGIALDTGTLIILPRPATLSVVSGDGQQAAPGTALALPVGVRLVATDGLPIGGAVVSAAVTSGGGTITPLASVTDSLGVLPFRWTLGTSTGTQSVTISSLGVPDVVVTATSIISVATRLTITQQIGPTFPAGDSLQVLLVEARNPQGVRDTTWADSVNLSFATNPTQAALLGTTRVRAVAGLARFDQFRIQRAGTGYRLLASSLTLAADTSAVFNVAPGAASVLGLFSGGGQSASPGAALPQPIVVKVADAYGNPVAGHVVSFSTTTGSLSAAADTTDGAGLASVSWTLGAVAGAQSLTVTATGLAGSPLSVTANGAPLIVTTSIAPVTDTLTAIGATRLFTATARDGLGNPVQAEFLWASRDTTVASVDATGRVTAMANGQTWVVATEIGGTRDSARVVVEQRLATIAVTPGARSIYLGASFAFTASAVDGLGVPMAVQPAFTWTTGSSAIATITVGGIAMGVGLGATQVRATAGTVTGVAGLTVLTPITRIAVVRDSIGFVVNDTFSLAALAQTRSYRAIAYDTLDIEMPGVAFTWASSNPSVAALDSSGAATARAVAVANGITAIRATAQGVVGAARLTVAQVMVSIDLSPVAVSIVPTGSAVLTPRRRDANGFFIPGGAFTFTSLNPSVATVSATGVVTGVALGSTTVTATSDLVTSNATAITVASTVPPIISFGRDTLAIGRSATSVAIPVYLSMPHTSVVTVNLAVADTFAYFSAASISIPVGQTVGTAYLNGRNAGTTTLFATDGGGGGAYAGDTAVLAVQASVRFATSSYAMNANDERPAQVQLTDPAPAGGSYITFEFTTPGVASVSPNPAFIPAGQLSADVVIRGTAAGTTFITPAATGVNGIGSGVTVSAAVLQVSSPAVRMGAGQFVAYLYASVQQPVSSPLAISLVSSDTMVAKPPTQIVIPAGSSYAYFQIAGRNPGAATTTLTAPGWTGAAVSVVVTTPNVGLSGGGTFNTTNPALGVTVYSRDSTFASYNRTSSLAVQLSSSDTTVLKVITPSVTIPAGQNYANGQVIAGGSVGTAWLYATASGHGVDSVQYTFVGPKLAFSWVRNVVGAGQYDQFLYVYTPNPVLSDLTVTIANTDSLVAAAPVQVTISAGFSYQYFTVRGKTPGTSRMVATAVGYTPSDTATYAVSTPHISLSGGGTVSNFATPTGLSTYVIDSLGASHYRSDTLVISYVSTDTLVMTVAAADTVLPGSSSAWRALATPVSVGTASIIASAPGHGADTAVYTVSTPKLSFSFSTALVGRRQYMYSNTYVYTPNIRGVAVPVTITHTNAPVDSLSTDAPTIAAGSSYAYFDIAGLGLGTDTLVASAPGYLPDTAVVIVTTPRLLASALPGSATTTSPPASVTVYAADSVGTPHFTLDTLLVRATSSDIAVIQPDSVGFRIPRGASSVAAGVRFVGPGMATMSYFDSLGTGYAPSGPTNTVTVTGPSLSIYNYSPMLGMRQNGGMYAAYAAIPNAIATPLVVNLLSTDSTVASVPASVTIPSGQTYAYFTISARDVAGTVQIQASAVGYSGASVLQQVTLPRFLLYVPGTLNTTSPPYTISVTAADANGSPHYVNEPVTVTLSSSNPAVGALDSATVVIPAGGNSSSAARFAPSAAGTTTITASDARGTGFSYTSASGDIAVVTPSLALSWAGPLALGIGQWADPYVSVPDTRTSALLISLAHATAASTSAASHTMPIGTTIVATRITGAAAGVDTITYTAAGHGSISGAISVGLGRVDGLSGWPTSLAANGDSVLVTLHARDPGGAVRNVAAITTFSLAASNGAIEIHDTGAGNPTITSVSIPADGSQVAFYVKRISAGTATLTITNANYQQYTTPAVGLP